MPEPGLVLPPLVVVRLGELVLGLDGLELRRLREFSHLQKERYQRV